MTQTTEVPTDTQEIVGLMRAIGQAWRGDWGDFDGRTLRDQLSELAEIVQEAAIGVVNVPEKITWFYGGWGICRKCQSWSQDCDCGAAS